MTTNEVGSKRRWARAAGRLGLSVGAGLCAAAAWPSVDIWPLVFLVPTLLLLSIEGLSAGRRFLVGWLGGTVAFSLTFHWVYVTMRDMTSFPWAAAVGALVLFGLAHGLLWALFAWWVGPIRRRLGGAWFFVAAVLWMAMEHVFPFLFPIFLGYALWSSHFMIQAADIVGVPGLTFIIFFAGGGIADDCVRRGASRIPRYIGVALVVLVALYGWVRPADVLDRSVLHTLDVGVVQPNIQVEEKHSPDALVRYRMLQRAVKQTDALIVAGGEPDLLMWPEGSSPFVQRDFERARRSGRRATSIYERSAQVFVEQARRARLGLTFGSMRRVGERTRNAAVFIPSGEGEVLYYDKHLLVPFGETIPFSDTFPSLRGSIPGISDFERGSERVFFPLDEIQALPTICYENIFSGFVRDGLSEGGDMFVNYTNDMWFGDTRALDLHLMAQAIRCVENRVPLVRATGTGVSAFVDATGSVVERSERLVPTFIRGTVEVRDVWSFHRAFGDVFFWLLLAGAVLVLVLRWSRNFIPVALSQRRNGGEPEQ